FIMNGKVTILMFHRVTDTFFDISLLIKRKTFEECMKYIAQSYPVISMDFLVQNFDKWENIPDDSFVITFDDGWIDFHDVAYPIISRLKVPATVYLTTGFVSSECSYWQERLNNLLTQILANKKLLSKKDDIISMPEINLKLKDLISKGDGKSVIFEFIDYLKKFTNDKILRTIFDLGESLKEYSIMISEDEHRSFVNWDELNSIKEPDISFGSHTVNHPILTNEQTNVIENEICKSKEIIEKETGREVSHFCYPNGNYNDQIKGLVSGSYKSACTTNSGFVSKESDIYALNRIGINEEMVIDWRGNFSKYVFTLSLFLESIRQ
ncbi:MAG: polysaccharide deacetylase family protein, partial [Candidatus Scalindua sp.]